MTSVRQNNTQLIIILGVLALATLIIYWPGMQGQLLLDDNSQLKPIIYGINSSNWAEQYKEYIISTSGIFKRPVSMATFILNAATVGADIWYWKLTNVILHIITGYVVFLLIRVILLLNNSENRCVVDMVSICITAAWLFHPLQVSTVLYLVQRMTILSTLFTLSALLSYIQGFIRELNDKSGTIQLLFSALVFFPLALFSKENSALLPIYVFITTIYISKCKVIPIVEIPKAIKIYNITMFLVVIGGINLLVIYNDSLIFDAYELKSFTLYERILTEPRVLLMYLTQIVAPFPSMMGFFHDDYVISTSILNPYTTLISIIIILFSLIIIIFFAKKLPLAAFGLLFFLSSHLLESTFLPLEIAFEHRNYLGLFGVFILLSAIIVKKIEIPLFGIINIIFIILTFQRATMWGNPNIMYHHMLSVHPESQRLNILFANAYTDAMQYNKALQYLQGYGGFGIELHRLIIQCLQKGEISPGTMSNLIKEKNHIIIDNYELDRIITLSNLGLDNECTFNKLEFAEFLKYTTKHASSKNINIQKILIYLAHYYRDIGYVDKSISALEKSFAADTSNPIPLFLMAEWLINGNMISEARLVYNKANNISNDSIYDYSDFKDRIGLMLSSYKPN